MTSARLAEANDIILRRYYISQTPAHTLAARACLSYLLHLDEDVTIDSLGKLLLTDYAEDWLHHARPEEVSQNVKDGLKELFDPSKPHLAACIWICDPILPSWERRLQSEKPSPLRGTPLHYAALWDLDSVVELLVNELSQNVNSRDFADSATPLHVASRCGHMKIARRLLGCIADVEAQDKDKETPLHVGSKHGQLKVARMLIERGASMSAQNKDGQAPLHLASQVGRLDVVRMLIEGGADVSPQDKDGQTPLHLVSQAGRLGVVRMLIEGGADVSAQDNDGQTSLHLASQAWRLDVVRMLIELGTDVSAQGKDGQTPLHLASQAGRLDVVRMLIEGGAHVSAQDKNGETPLHLVSQAGRLDVVCMLIKGGADVSAQDKDGQTPLHLASQAGQLDVVRMLIEGGADVSAQDNDGQTLLHLGSQSRRLDVVRMFMERVADVSVNIRCFLESGLILVLFYFFISELFHPTLYSRLGRMFLKGGHTGLCYESEFNRTTLDAPYLPHAILDVHIFCYGSLIMPLIVSSTYVG